MVLGVPILKHFRIDDSIVSAVLVSFTDLDRISHAVEQSQIYFYPLQCVVFRP